MERLIAFEFVAASDEPQQVVVRNKGVMVVQVGFRSWIGLNLDRCKSAALEFEDRQDLTIDGVGIGKPYWHGDQPPSWVLEFVGSAELRRINAIRAAARGELNAAALRSN